MAVVTAPLKAKKPEQPTLKKTEETEGADTQNDLRCKIFIDT